MNNKQSEVMREERFSQYSIWRQWDEAVARHAVMVASLPALESKEAEEEARRDKLIGELPF